MILIDTCTLHCVFGTDSDDHSQFKPVLDFLYNKNGKFVYGGTKYNDELKKAKKYLKFITQLEKAAKVIRCSDNDVDEMMDWVSAQEDDPDFDDSHLIAIVIVSKTPIVCTRDKRAMPFIKKSSLYPKRFKRPKIYASLRNKKLLET